MTTHTTHTLKVFGGTGNPRLTKSICDYLDLEPGRVKIDRFPDGEKIIKLESDVRGKDCFIIQSTCAPVDTNLMELLIFLDCLKRASARRVTAVIPYFGYARQDRKDEGRVPITAKLVANMITAAGADRVLSLDLHAAQLQGFFDIPVDHLLAEPVLIDYFKEKNIADLTLVSPDVGNMKRAASFAAALGGELAIIHKKRINGAQVEHGKIIGDVKGRNVLMCDDMISTAGTVSSAASLVKEMGAKNIFAGASHGVFAGTAIERLNAAPFDEIVVTDSIPQTDKVDQIEKLKVLTVSKLLGEAVKRIHQNKSVSSMFKR